MRRIAVSAGLLTPLFFLFACMCVFARISCVTARGGSIQNIPEQELVIAELKNKVDELKSKGLTLEDRSCSPPRPPLSTALSHLHTSPKLLSPC